MDKKPYAVDYYRRFARQVGTARDFVARIGRSDPVRDIVDVDGLANLLRTVDPEKNRIAARDTIPKTLYLIRFLRQFPEFQIRS